MTENCSIGITVLGSGSRGNCTLVHCGNDAIMVDAGFSAKETLRRMKLAGLENMRIRAILVTHEHADHVKGLRVCSEALDAPVFASMKCAQMMRCKDDRLHQMATFAPGGQFDIGSITVCPFSVPHDACDPVAFSFICGDSKFAIATDIGYASSMVEYELQDCDTIVLESNHDLNMLAASSRPWSLKQRIMGRQGHLSNDASMQLLADVLSQRTRHVVLAHLSSECNREDIARSSAEHCLEALDRNDVTLDIASQDRPMATIWLM